MLCCACAVLVVKRKEDYTSRERDWKEEERAFTRFGWAWRHGDGRHGAWLWSREERTTDRPSAPAEAVYAVHDALPNLLWGCLVLYVPCTEPRHPPARFSGCEPSTLHFLLEVSQVFKSKEETLPIGQSMAYALRTVRGC